MKKQTGPAATPKASRPRLPGSFVFRPKVVIAWSQFMKDATRWEF